MIGFLAGKMVDRDDLVPAALSQDVLTVFQFYAYIIQHEVQDMETHLLHLAREGESEGRPPGRKKPSIETSLQPSESVSVAVQTPWLRS